MNRRSQITMSESELSAFLDGHRVVTCATIGREGRPHLMPLWYVADGSVLSAWTYGKSQKVRNLERLPQATLLVEAGYDRYGELRGAMLECDVDIVRDPAAVTEVGMRLAARYGGGASVADLTAQARTGVLKQAAKRIVLVFRPTRIVTWDHRKLSGGY